MGSNRDVAKSGQTGTQLGGRTGTQLGSNREAARRVKEDVAGGEGGSNRDIARGVEQGTSFLGHQTGHCELL